MHPLRPSLLLPSSSFHGAAASSSDTAHRALDASLAQSATIEIELREQGDRAAGSESPGARMQPRRRLSFHEDTVFHEKERNPLTHLARRRDRLTQQLQTRQQHLLGLWDQLQEVIGREQQEAPECGREPLSTAERRLIETPLAAAIGLVQAPKAVRTWRWEPFYRQTLPAVVALRGHELAMRLLPELSLMWAAMHDALDGETPRLEAGFFPETWRWMGELQDLRNPFQKVMEDFSLELKQRDDEQSAAWRQEQLIGEALGILQAHRGARSGPATAKIVAAARQAPLAPTKRLSSALLQLARVAIEERSTGLAREVLGAVSGDPRCLPLSLGTGSGMASSSFQGGPLARGPVVLRSAPVLEEDQLSEIPSLWRTLIQGAAPSHQPAFDAATATGRCLGLAHWVSEGAMDRALVFEALADLEGADQAMLLETGVLWVATGDGMRETSTTVDQRHEWWREAQEYLKRQFQARGASLVEEMTMRPWPGCAMAQFVLQQWASSLDRISAGDALSRLEYAERVIRSGPYQAERSGDLQAVLEWTALWVAADELSLDELRARIQELAPAIRLDCLQAFLELGPRLAGILSRLERDARAVREETRPLVENLLEQSWLWELTHGIRSLEQTWQQLAAENRDHQGRQEAADSHLWAVQVLLERGQAFSLPHRSRYLRTLESLQCWLRQAKRLRAFAPVEPLAEAQQREVQRVAKGIELEAVQRLYGPWAAASQLSQESLIEQTTRGRAPIWSLAEREEFAMAIVERAQTADEHDFVGAVCRNLLRDRPWADSNRKYEENHRHFPAANAQGLRCTGRMWHAQDLKEKGLWLQEQCRLYLQAKMRYLGTLQQIDRRNPSVIAVASLLKLITAVWPEPQQEVFLSQMAPFIAIQPEPILTALRRAHELALAQRIRDAILQSHCEVGGRRANGAASGSQRR